MTGSGARFPKCRNLLQYVSNGNYYGRIKVGGKVIRRLIFILGRNPEAREFPPNHQDPLSARLAKLL